MHPELNHVEFNFNRLSQQIEKNLKNLHEKLLFMKIAATNNSIQKVQLQYIFLLLEDAHARKVA